MAEDRVVGSLGRVVRRIRGGRLPGEIRVVVSGEPELYLAYSPDPLDEGVRVRVIGSRGSRQVDVEEWPRVSRPS